MERPSNKKIDRLAQRHADEARKQLVDGPGDAAPRKKRQRSKVGANTTRPERVVTLSDVPL
jgi:hypothetical protein